MAKSPATSRNGIPSYPARFRRWRRSLRSDRGKHLQRLLGRAIGMLPSVLDQEVSALYQRTLQFVFEVVACAARDERCAMVHVCQALHVSRVGFPGFSISANGSMCGARALLGDLASMDVGNTGQR